MLTLYIFMFFIIVAALVAVETPHALSAVVSLGAVGFGLSIVCLFIGAPDIAITLVVVEILVLIHMIRVTLKREIPTIMGPFSRLNVIATMLIFGLGVAFFYQVALELPPFGKAVMTMIENSPSIYYLKESLGQTEAASAITAVLLEFRAYDTLGEATVIFTAIIGAVMLLQRRVRRSSERKGGGNGNGA
jgi:multisubunit Na+/H+ antiporter MnhB subunit